MIALDQGVLRLLADVRKDRYIAIYQKRGFADHSDIGRISICTEVGQK